LTISKVAGFSLFVRGTFGVKGSGISALVNYNVNIIILLSSELR